MITIQLSNQTKSGAFGLCRRTLQRMGFTTLDSDEHNGWLCASKPIKGEEQVLFFEIQVNSSSRVLKIILQSSLLADERNLIAESISEEVFMETFHDLLRMAPPDNPMKLSNSDYSLITGLYA